MSHRKFKLENRGVAQCGVRTKPRETPGAHLNTGAAWVLLNVTARGKNDLGNFTYARRRQCSGRLYNVVRIRKLRKLIKAQLVFWEKTPQSRCRREEKIKRVAMALGFQASRTRNKLPDELF